ncbi:protein ALTERED PHOSPHATE STARVATION RESPONSE 1 [Euphorbia lathyris]|uniref:protein ALTERED PHOSPHATE STARVATION RESPONSE 1 n=1 Tax=Euphorbia lathyris TaxID=212925 RepID=UPI0033141343
MGAAGSKIEEDKALQLCRERKKFVRQALDGRCSLAAAHVTYVQSLRSTGTALRKFVEHEAQVESSLYTSTNATPEPLGLTEKSLSHYSIPSPSLSHPVDANDNFSPTPSPPSSNRFHANHMKFRGFYSTKVEEKPPLDVTGTITSSSTPQNTTPRSTEKPETSPFESSSVPSGTPPWDYFGLFHPIDHQFSFQEEKEMKPGENVDDIRRLREEEGIPELEDDEEHRSFHASEESEVSEDEFDDPPTDTLVRRFENLNRVQDHVAPSASPTMPSAGSVASETELPNGEKNNSPDLSPLRNAPDLSPLRNAPDLSPLRNAPDLSPSKNPASSVAISSDAKKTPMKEDRTENKVPPKDFFSSIKEIELLFIKASEAGKEVPRMLEANKLHFRPIVAGKENGSVASTFFKACFSCGEDPSQVQEEPAQNSVKYLTWHRTTSSRSSSSRNPLGSNVKDENEDINGDIFESFCMISGSHASTLDRLYAWERKLYDEVKASEMVRKEYDSKRTVLRQLESKGELSHKIDKTRAVVKDLHSRIRVAIHRIDSISKRIEDLRDKELQPQLEELIDGLSRMWGVMFECHRLQFQIISVADNNGSIKFSLHSESHRQIAMHLENELYSLSSYFMKWIDAQRSYLQAINDWLFKCVFLPEERKKKKRRQRPPSWTLRRSGPPIYETCGVWLEKIEALPAKEVVDAIKGLAAETAHLLPRQEKNHGKNTNLGSWKVETRSDSGINMLRGEEDSDDFISGPDRFRSSFEGFLGQLNNFSECCVQMYAELRKAIHDVKNPHPPPQPQVI